MKNWTEIFGEKIVGWWHSLLRLLPEILLALVVMVIAIFVGRWVRKGLYHAILRFSGKRSVGSLFATIAQALILITGLFIMLDILNLNRAVTSILAGAGIIGIILGFAFQDITANFISGVYIALKRPFEVGHTVKTNDFIGHIEDIQLRSTVIRTFSGLHLMIPNKEIIQKPMINYSLTEARRIELDFYIDHTSDLEEAHRAIFSAVSRIKYLYPGKAVEIYFNDVKFTAIKISVWFWINNHEPPGYMVSRHDAIFNIIQALKEVDIELVLPLSLDNLQTTAKV